VHTERPVNDRQINKVKLGEPVRSIRLIDITGKIKQAKRR